jgi:hypothetical protein
MGTFNGLVNYQVKDQRLQKVSLINVCLEINLLNVELNPIRHLLAQAGAHHFVDVSRIRVNEYILWFSYTTGTIINNT